MALYKQSNQIWDPIRCKYVASTPEEVVRQKWIHEMTTKLGYPRSLISVEKSVATFTKGHRFTDPKRRIDILCYMNRSDGLTPLVVIECKAEFGGVPEAQLRGYNFHIGAPFFCVIQKDLAKTFWMEGDQIHSVPFLPKYQDLINSL